MLNIERNSPENSGPENKLKRFQIIIESFVSGYIRKGLISFNCSIHCFSRIITAISWLIIFVLGNNEIIFQCWNKLVSKEIIVAFKCWKLFLQPILNVTDCTAIIAKLFNRVQSNWFQSLSATACDAIFYLNRFNIPSDLTNICKM